MRIRKTIVRRRPKNRGNPTRIVTEQTGQKSEVNEGKSEHEGPQGISKRGVDIPLLPGMILSSEPCHYKASISEKGEYGLVRIIETPDREDFYEFETLTLAPLDEFGERLSSHSGGKRMD